MLRNIRYYLWGDGSKEFYTKLFTETAKLGFVCTLWHYSDQYKLAEPLMTDIIKKYPQFDASDCSIYLTVDTLISQCSAFVSCPSSGFGSTLGYYAGSICQNSIMNTFNDLLYYTKLPSAGAFGFLFTVGYMLCKRREPVAVPVINPALVQAPAVNHPPVQGQLIELQVIPLQVPNPRFSPVSPVQEFKFFAPPSPQHSPVNQNAERKLQIPALPQGRIEIIEDEPGAPGFQDDGRAEGEELKPRSPRSGS